MALTFFKTPKHKTFNYRPVYYDKKKEDREKLMKSAYEEGGNDYEQALRDRMQMRWRRNTGTKDKRTSQKRLIIIVFIIVSLFYLVFFV